MFNIIIKTAVIYLTIVVALRVMGKRQIGQLQPYELVLALLIAELTAKPMDTPGTPLSYGLVSVTTLILLYFFITRLSLKSDLIKKLIDGKPSIVISRGVIMRSELSRLDYSLNDLLEQIRGKGFSDVCEVDYAILETNGQLSVFPVAEKAPATVGDLCLKKNPTSMACAVIVDGKLQKDNLKKCGLEQKSVERALSQAGIADPRRVFYASIHDCNKLFIQQKNGNVKHASLPRGETDNG